MSSARREERSVIVLELTEQEAKDLHAVLYYSTVAAKVTDIFNTLTYVLEIK